MHSVTERRRHVVYVTTRTEYHCRGHECVAVRDRHSGRWQREHQALRAKLVGSKDSREGPLFEGARVGARLFFLGREAVLTSPVVAAGRPPREAVVAYASYCAAGAIGV